MDILTYWKTLTDHSLLKFKEGQITDKPEYICAENQISSHLLNKKNRIKNVISLKADIYQLVNRII